MSTIATPWRSASRIVIAGGPRVGKTTLARGYEGSHRVRHTDDLIKLHNWNDASEAAAGWMTREGPWAIEGVSVPRALRKWMRTNDGKPCDVALWLAGPKAELSDGQLTMAKGCLTVWNEILDELHNRGVHVEVIT